MISTTLLMAFASLPCALVLGAAIDPRDVGLKWSGSVFPGGQTVELWGTAEEIYDQILALNPNYAPEDSGEAMVKNTTITGNNSGKRSRWLFMPDDADESRFSCASMATGNSDDVVHATQFLSKLGGTCGAPARQCRRMTCQDTTGSYFCSEEDKETMSPCRHLADYVDAIRYNCCPNSLRSVSGSLGSYAPYSVWTGYANCAHKSSKRPTDYPYPGGDVNWRCV